MVALVVLVVLGGCGDAPTAPRATEPAVPATTAGTPSQIAVSPASATASSLGETVQFTASVLSATGAPVAAGQLVWTSSDSTVLVNEGNGRFRSRGNGSATISVSIVGNDRVPVQSAPVLVQQRAVELRLSSDSLALYAIGQMTTVRLRLLDALGSPVVNPSAIVWQSANAAIATVDAAGTVTAQGDGEVAVSVQAANLTKTLTTRVASTIVISGCVSSADTDRRSCADSQLAVRNPR
jgi:hypothetical protein